MKSHHPRSKAGARSNLGPALQCCIAYNAYGGFCVPLSSRHRPAAQTVLAGGVWEPGTIDFLQAHCEDGDVVHAGVFFGDFLPALSDALAPGAKVWAFEPNPENFRCACITALVNGLQNVELVNAALGARAGVLPLVTSDIHGEPLGGGSRISDGDGGQTGERSIAVSIVTIDEMVPPERNVSVIHLDVEGFERPALTGAHMTIRRCKPILILETLPEKDWLARNLLDFGYRIANRVNGNVVLRSG